MKSMKVFLGFSVLLNLCLFGWIVGVDGGMKKVATPNVVNVEELTEEQRFLDALKKELIPHMPDEYWKPKTNKIARSVKAVEKMKDAVLERYGAAAVNSPVFRELLHPLGDDFNFLSSDEQFAVQGLISKLQTRRHFGSVDAPSYREAQKNHYSQVARLLGEEKYFEYIVRQSPFARRLRDMDLNLSEREFRRIMRVRAGLGIDGLLGSGGSGIASQKGNIVLSTYPFDKGVENILGHDRYLAYLRQMDRFYKTLTFAASERGVPQRKIDTAYQIYLESQHEIQENSNADIYEVLRIRKRANRDMSEILGGMRIPRRADDALPKLLRQDKT